MNMKHYTPPGFTTNRGRSCKRQRIGLASSLTWATAVTPAWAVALAPTAIQELLNGAHYLGDHAEVAEVVAHAQRGAGDNCRRVAPVRDWGEIVAGPVQDRHRSAGRADFDVITQSLGTGATR